MWKYSANNVQIILSIVQVMCKSFPIHIEVVWNLCRSHEQVLSRYNASKSCASYMKVNHSKCNNCLPCQFFSSSWRLKGFSVLFFFALGMEFFTVFVTLKLGKQSNKVLSKYFVSHWTQTESKMLEAYFICLRNCGREIKKLVKSADI